MFVKDQVHYIGKILGISHSQCSRVLHRQISCLSWFYIENTSFVLVIVKKRLLKLQGARTGSEFPSSVNFPSLANKIHNFFSD